MVSMKGYFMPVLLILIHPGPAPAQKAICTNGFGSGLNNWTIEKVSDKTALKLKYGALEVIAPDGVTL
jgi:hypothetical protein